MSGLDRAADRKSDRNFRHRAHRRLRAHQDLFEAQSRRRSERQGARFAIGATAVAPENPHAARPPSGQLRALSGTHEPQQTVFLFDHFVGAGG